MRRPLSGMRGRAALTVAAGARDMGFFGTCTCTCTFAEPPFTMQFFNDPLRGNFWRASVQLHCAQ